MPAPTRDSVVAATIADDLPVGIWVAEATTGALIYANLAFDRIMGTGPVPGAAKGDYSRSYGIRTRAGEPYPESELPFSRALAAGATVVVDDLVIHRVDGSRVFVRAVAKPFFDVEGRPTHVAVAFTDVTREIEAGRAAAEAQERLRQVVSGASVVLFAFDQRGVYTLLEGSGVALSGRPADAFLGRHVSQVFPDDPEMTAGFERVLRGESITREVRVGPATFESRITPQRDATGAVIGGIGVATDVTARSRMQERLLQAERMASLGTLAACVAHEINNPLFAATASLELLSRRLGPSADGAVRDLLAAAQEAVGRVQNIAGGLKTFARFEERPGDSADLNQVLDSALGLGWNQLRHRARVVKRYGQVPRVRGNEGRLAQVFLNLLVNAAQAIDEGQADRNEVRVTSRHDAAGVTVEIFDTGHGIPADELGRIFDPFFSTKPIGMGSGLGLPICRELVGAVGGTIDVESAPGRGTTFRVVLPVADPVREPARPPEPAVPVISRRARILVLDDDPMIRDLVQRLLTVDHEVQVFEDPRRAVAAIEAGARFDVIVCDLMMPQLSGMDVFDRIATVAPDQARRMMFMTGGAFTSRAREFMARTTNPALDKPFSSRALLRAVQVIMGRPS